MYLIHDILSFNQVESLDANTSRPTKIPDVYANIMRMKPDGTSLQVYAKGIRNSIGFDWDPVTKALLFTDNGRDTLGDNIPSDELNYASQAGMHFGYPYCRKGSIPSPQSMWIWLLRLLD